MAISKRKKQMLRNLLIGVICYTVISEIIGTTNDNKLLKEANDKLEQDYQDLCNKSTSNDITVYNQKWKLRELAKKYDLAEVMNGKGATAEELKEFKSIIGMDTEDESK